MKYTNGYLAILATLLTIVGCSEKQKQNLAANETKIIPTQIPGEDAPADQEEAARPDLGRDKETRNRYVGTLGHSEHGIAFDGGPRIPSELLDGMPNVHFPITTSSELTQKFFDQGIGQLHGFWNYEAERSFRTAHMNDQDCAMCYWGLSMSNTVFRMGDSERAALFIVEAKEMADANPESLTPREIAHINALALLYDEESTPSEVERRINFLKALRDIFTAYPEDVDAQAFYVMFAWFDNYIEDKVTGTPAIYNALGETDKSLNEHLLAVFAVNPMHPAHHYKIHLWDKDETRDRAIESAYRSGPSAPGIAHMWHMAGHTFSKYDRHWDATFHQMMSANVDHGHMMRTRTMPYFIQNYFHNNGWLAESLEAIGDVDTAIAVAANIATQPVHPKYNKPSSLRSGYSKGIDNMVTTWERYEYWDQLLALDADSMFTRFGTSSDVRTARNKAQGVAAFWKGSEARLVQEIGKIEEYIPVYEGVLRESGSTEAEIAEDSVVELARKRIGDLRIYQELMTLQTSREEEGADQEAIAEKMEELIERLVENGDSYFDQIAKLYGEVKGDTKKAVTYARKSVDAKTNQPLSLATLAWWLFQDGQEAEGNFYLGRLQDVSWNLTMTAPPFARLQPYMGDNWQRTDSFAVSDYRASDLPDLSTLIKGFVPWEPPVVATTETLKDVDNNDVSIDSFKGKKVLFVFYLGKQCAACVDQLDDVLQRADEFMEKGLEIVAISVEGQEDLQTSEDVVFQNYPHLKDDVLVLGDPNHRVFEIFDAYDVFEDEPLHGTIIVDEQSRIRWSDTGVSPYYELDFLLKEVDRLFPQTSEAPSFGPAPRLFGSPVDFSRSPPQR